MIFCWHIHNLNRYRFVLNEKVIWDNLEFVDINYEIMANNRRTVDFCLSSMDDDEYISICGWKINIKSAIHPYAAAIDVHTGWNSLNDILKLKSLDSRHLCAPFFYLESYCHNINVDSPGSEPLLAMVLRLCHWIGRCIAIGGFESKHKEIRDCVNRPINYCGHYSE
jgi:hypothetical protein